MEKNNRQARDINQQNLYNAFQQSTGSPLFLEKNTFC